MDKAYLEKKFKQERLDLEKETLIYLEKVNELDQCTHMSEYEDYLNLIIDLERSVDEIKAKVERSLVEEELLFQFKVESFENWYKAFSKINKFALFWKKAFTFYEHKKAFMKSFSMEQDTKYSLEVVGEIEKDIKENKKEVKKNEEILLKMSRIIEEDILYFKDFLTIMKSLIETEDFSEDLRQKLLDIEENKKIDPSYKVFLKNVCSNKNFI